MVHTLDSSFLHKQGIDTLLGALIKLKNPKISEFTPDELWTGDIVPRPVCHFCHVLLCFTLTLLACPRRFNDLKQGESDDCLLSESKVTLQSLKKAGFYLPTFKNRSSRLRSTWRVRSCHSNLAGDYRAFQTVSFPSYLSSFVRGVGIIYTETFTGLIMKYWPLCVDGFETYYQAVHVCGTKSSSLT